MKEFVERIVKQLVDNPDQVRVSEVFTEEMVLLELRVAKEDMGKVLGKRGRTIDAIRILLNAVARRAHKRVTLELLE